MYILYGSIIAFMLIIVYGAWSRKQIYKEVDRLETRKIQLMNEPVTEELSKIKGLKMSGETEQRFEEWREIWDRIVTVHLPDIEEQLFDVEDLANKYRFSKAKRIIKLIDVELDKLNEHLQEMVEDVDQLVNSEEKNRQEIHKVKEYFQETQKRLWTQRGTLGIAGTAVEGLLLDSQQLFEDFDQNTKDGNYLQAREILMKLNTNLEYVNEIVGELPQYLLLIEKEIPRQVKDLENGLLEMKEKGFNLEHFSFEWQMQDIKQRLLTLLPLVENLKLVEVTEPIELIQKEIDKIYEKLEQEAISRQYVEQILPILKKKMEDLPLQTENLKKDTDLVKLSYRISEEEDRKHWKMEKQVKDITNQFTVIEDIMDEKKQSFTSLHKTIDEISGKSDDIENEIHISKEKLNHLLRDERSAEDTIQELKEKLLFGHKKLIKSNIPGVPEILLTELDEAKKALYLASERLNELPISIDEVTTKVNEAKEHVDKCVTKLLEVIEIASLAEKVIQYGNRYRRYYDDVNIHLLQAEEFFRQYEYEEALNKAVSSIQRVDPDVLEKVSTTDYFQSSST